MANNTHPKKAPRAEAAPTSNPSDNLRSIISGSRISQLTDLDAELAALADMTLAKMRDLEQDSSL